MGDQGMAYVPAPDDAQVIGHVQRRLLLTGGWLLLTYTTIGNRGANAEHALVGFALLLLGVFLVVLAPVANQFPGAARVGAAVADAVLFYFFAPGN